MSLTRYDVWRLDNGPYEDEETQADRELREQREALNDFAERAAQQAGVECEVDGTTLWLGIDAINPETADAEWQRRLAAMWVAMGGRRETVELGGKRYRVICEEVRDG